MLRVLDVIGPVLLVMLLGYALARSGFLQRAIVDGLSALVYWVSLPALIIHSLTVQTAAWGAAGRVAAVFALATLLVLAAGWLTARALRLDRVRLGTFLQAVFRGNLALIGLPLLIFAAGPDQAAAVTAFAVLVMAPAMLGYNIGAVLLLTFTCGQAGGGLWRALLSLRTNPLILATLVGVLLQQSPLRLPAFLGSFFGMLGGTAAPLALLCIGSSLAAFRLGARMWTPLAAALLKVVALPLIALLLGLAWRLDNASLHLLLLFAATPSAAASVILARQMGGDEALAAAAVALSTLLSLAPLALVIGWFG
jgi:hypothetical protein